MDAMAIDDDTAYYSTPTQQWSDSSYSSEFNANKVNPGASSWADVFKYGIGRAADYSVARVNMQNTNSSAGLLQQYQIAALRTQNQNSVSSQSLLMILVIAGAAFMIMKAA